MALSVNIWPQTDVAFLLACDNEACDKARVLDEKERKQKCFHCKGHLTTGRLW